MMLLLQADTSLVISLQPFQYNTENCNNRTEWRTDTITIHNT